MANYVLASGATNVFTIATANSTSYSVVLQAAMAAGAVPHGFAFQYLGNNTPPTVTDSLGGTYVVLGPATGNATHESPKIWAFYRLNAGAGMPTVTAQFDPTARNGGIALAAIDGLPGGGSLFDSLFDFVDGSVAAGTASPNVRIAHPTAVVPVGAFESNMHITNTGTSSYTMLPGFVRDAGTSFRYVEHTHRKVFSAAGPLEVGYGQSQNAKLTGAALAFVGAVSAPVITGPTGAAGAASISLSVATGASSVGTWSATNGGTWSLTGTDAAALAISAGGVVAKASGTFNSATQAGYIFNVVNTGAGGVATQAVTLTVNPPAPVLSSPSGAATGATTGTGSVTTDTANGALKFLATTNATESQATVLASSQSQAVTSAGAQSVSFAGLATGVAVFPHYVHTNASGLSSAVASGASFTPSAGGSAPAITAQPTNQSASAGGSATFTSAASGSPTPTLQWQELISSTATDMAGQTSGALTLTSLALASNGRQFRLKATNSVNVAFSNWATLTVTNPGQTRAGIKIGISLPNKHLVILG